MAKKKVKKLIKRRPAGTIVNIKIDNSRRTQARKPTDIKPKGHINLPITYYSQFQPARSVITDQRPNMGFNSTDMYQKQFQNYFDDKLSSLEKKILEESEKKNTAPPKPAEQPGAYNRVSDYDDNLLMETRKAKLNPPPNNTNIISNSNLEDIKEATEQRQFTNVGWNTPKPKPQQPVGAITPVGFGSVIDELNQRFTTITEAEPVSQTQSTVIAQELTPKTFVRGLTRKQRKEVKKESNDADVEENIDDARNTYLKLTKRFGIEPKEYERASDYSRESGKLADSFYKGKLFNAIKENKDPLTKTINSTKRQRKAIESRINVDNMNINRQAKEITKTFKDMNRTTGSNYNLRKRN